jgi:hypothetical protein
LVFLPTPYLPISVLMEMANFFMDDICE